MGAYLSEPITEKESTDESNDFLTCGASSMQGWRMSQEVRKSPHHHFDLVARLRSDSNIYNNNTADHNLTHFHTRTRQFAGESKQKKNVFNARTHTYI